ncbi:bola protein [Protomyces lactucae-debilis]|uniref:Bola protein n=1 Tax=Protomyces lactucae-debilis TaxID=2754530 RepID=A0A1Y2FP25_PROLT|nr:bola protein [Protomyces lactucae-debilis]ORY85723.1 bola protein [Protomyces lactucae-debilis]
MAEDTSAPSTTSGVDRQQLDTAIRSRLAATHVEIEDISGGCGQAYEVVIVSGKFEGLRTLQRHKLVMKELMEEVKAVHAFTQRDYTPAEWQQIKDAE